MTDSPPEKNRPADPVEWLDRYGDYLYNYAWSRLRDNSAAEDMVQETFLAALKARPGFSGKSTERTWLVGILRHKIVDHLRKVLRQLPDDTPEQLPNEAEEPFWPSGEWRGHWRLESNSPAPINWGSNPAAFLEQKEFWEIFESCMQDLPQRLAMVFTLHVMEEIPAEEICKEMKITATNLWVMLFRTRRQLRRCLEKRWIAEPTGRGGRKNV